MTRWQLEENAAEEYERYLVPAFFAPFADRLIELAQPQLADRALDVACGTGIVARRVVSRVHHVVGLDVNPAWWTLRGPPTRRSSGWSPMRPRCRCPTARATLSSASRACSTSRTAQPGCARCVACSPPAAASPSVSGGRPSTTRAGSGWPKRLTAMPAPEVGAIMRAPFALGDQELRDLLADFRDVVVRIRIAAVRFPSASELLRRQQVASPLAGPLSALADQTHDALVRDFADALRPHADDDGVSFPMETHVVTAIR